MSLVAEARTVAIAHGHATSAWQILERMLENSYVRDRIMNAAHSGKYDVWLTHDDLVGIFGESLRRFLTGDQNGVVGACARLTDIHQFTIYNRPGALYIAWHGQNGRRGFVGEAYAASASAEARAAALKQQREDEIFAAIKEPLTALLRAEMLKAARVGRTSINIERRALMRVICPAYHGWTKDDSVEVYIRRIDPSICVEYTRGHISLSWRYH